jgi:hypothetical protein
MSEGSKDRLLPPRAPRKADSIVGIVDALAYRTEAAGRSMNARTIYNFRLRVVDREGTEKELLGVEIRGLGFKGSLNNGDWVEIERSAQKRPGEAITTHKLRNLTTGGDVEGRRFRF